MAEDDNDRTLPKHWRKKSSRRCPTLAYYFNTKTGVSSWIHPHLLKSTEDISKGSKELKKPPNKHKIMKNKVCNLKDRATDNLLEKQDKAEVTSPASVNASSHSPVKVSPLQESISDTKSAESKAKEEENWRNRTPVKFCIKTKTDTKFTNEPQKDALKEKKHVVPVHSSLLRVRKIAKRVQWSKKEKDKEVKLQSEQTAVPSLKLKKEITTSDAKCKRPAESDEEVITPVNTRKVVENDKKVITPISTRKVVKAKRRIHDARKVEEGESIIRAVIEELSGSPPRNDGEHKPTRKEKKDMKKQIKRKENDVYKHFIKSKEESRQFLKTSWKETVPSEETKLPTVDKSVHKQETLTEDAEEDSDEVTEMEVEEQEIITEIANFRGSVSHSYKTESCQLLTTTINSSSESLYIVVDTNILIQDIRFLESLKSKKITGKEVVIVIPYTALQEMDGLKKNGSIGKACQHAICWCNSHFENSDPRVQGQSYDNYLKTLTQNQRSSGDDLIRDCCLFLKKENLDVCLLTNDVNLRNKALMSAITAFGIRGLKLKLKEEESSQMTHLCALQDSLLGSPDQSFVGVDHIYNIYESINKFPEPENMVCEVSPKRLSLRQENGSKRVRKFRKSGGTCDHKDEKLVLKISTSLHATLSQILEFIMKDTYGDIWLNIVQHKPPWSLHDVFSCWQKHWIAVMIDKFPREVKALITNISKLLEECKRGSGDVVVLNGRVQNLYKFFRSQPYQNFIFPIHELTSENTDMSEIPNQSSELPSSDLVAKVNAVESPSNESEDPSIQQPTSSGVANVEKMINLVGAHITHFIALVLDAFGVPHSLPTLNTSTKMTREDAQGSSVNLHKVTMKLGTTIVRCLTEATSDSLQEFGNLLVNFWEEAKEPCPNLPFTEENLAQVVTSQSGRNFLQLTLGELERLLTMLVAVFENR